METLSCYKLIVCLVLAIRAGRDKEMKVFVVVNPIFIFLANLFLLPYSF